MPETRLVTIVETYLATVEETTLYRLPADADVAGLDDDGHQLATRLYQLGAQRVHSTVEVVAGSEGRPESVSVSEVDDPPGTLTRTFDDGKFQVVCADGEAYAVSTLEPGDVFFDEQTSDPVALCIVAPGYRRPDGRFEIRVLPESKC